MLNVGVFLFDKVELLDFAGPYEVFSVTSELNDNNLFKVFTISQDGNIIKTVNGLQIITDYSFKNHPKIDILIIPGGEGTKSEINKHTVLKWLNRNYGKSKITFSVCSGARLLGRLGLLDNLESITHHEVIPHLQKIAPKTIINKNMRFIDNGKLMTSAGISAGIDLSLYIVEKLCGKKIKNKTKVYMEYEDWKKFD
ncbi:DJ-1/PfpI family protein [Halocella sp. SP3-1]|uniref:DJ-1/PfpI family protein n=1 Tax=Halocella sp. SP3-1 TaxID=2382161 RepID=UPI000F7555FD|nr:DJ-1/PfpI family protein [Halocella sp. SP3-1]AZO95121.1 DJ-1/PfpI family protein [Halocella sp. SP3-1]